MPNIEFHGLKSYQNDDLRVLFARVWKYLEGASYAEETVVSYVESSVLNKKNEHQPFVRVWATTQDERDDIVQRLEPLDIDTELPLLLEKFILRKSERDKLIEKLKTWRPVAGTDSDFDYTPGNH